MKLGAYKINNIPVSEMTSVNVSDLKGRQPYIIAEKIPSGYKDISSIENLHLYGKGLIGSTFGFRDWKCLQREIKLLIGEKVKNNLAANWSKLTATEKKIACEYLLGKILPEHFNALDFSTAERTRLSVEFDSNNRRARGNSAGDRGRVQAARIYMFEKLGPKNAFELLTDIVSDRLFELFEFGIEGTEEDGHLGIIDFIQARKKTPYSVKGLKKRKYKVVDGSKDTMTDVADNLTAILCNGQY